MCACLRVSVLRVLLFACCSSLSALRCLLSLLASRLVVERVREGEGEGGRERERAEAETRREGRLSDGTRRDEQDVAEQKRQKTKDRNEKAKADNYS